MNRRGGGSSIFLPGAALFVLGLLTVGPLPVHPLEEPIPIQGVDTLTRERQGAGRCSEPLAEGWRQFHSGRSDQGRTIFEEVLARGDATPADRVQALYGQGLCDKFRRPVPRPEAARESFRAIVDEFPEGTLVPWALLELGILERKKWADLDHRGSGHENDPAREYFRRILQDYPQSLATHEAAVRLASSWFFEVQPEVSIRGVQILEEHLRRHPDNPLASTMHYRIAFWYLSVAQDYPKGVPHLVRQGEMKLCDPFRWGQNYWQIAQFLNEGLNLPEEAVPWYGKVIAEAPGTAMVLSARKRLAQLRRKLAAVPADAVPIAEEAGPEKLEQTPFGQTRGRVSGETVD